jgi:hypothetical protein
MVVPALPFPLGRHPVLSASCQNCFHFAIIFHFVAANILLQRWKIKDDNFSATNSPDIGLAMFSVDSGGMKLHAV